MSYSERSGVLTSWATKRQYRFSRTPDGSGKRQAIAQLEADDRDYRAAAEGRAGRSLTQRELLDLPHQKPKAGPQIISQPESNPRTNHWQRALADINKMPARTPAEKSQKRRMLEALESGSLKFQADLEAKDAREAMLNDPAIVNALEDARAKIERMQMMGDGISESDIYDARQRLADLEANALNPEQHESAAMTYFDAMRQADMAILDRYKARRKKLEDDAKAAADAIRAGEAVWEPAPEIPAPPAPTNDLQAAQQKAAELGIL